MRKSLATVALVLSLAVGFTITASAEKPFETSCEKVAPAFTNAIERSKDAPGGGFQQGVTMSSDLSQMSYCAGLGWPPFD